MSTNADSLANARRTTTLSDEEVALLSHNLNKVVDTSLEHKNSSSSQIMAGVLLNFQLPNAFHCKLGSFTQLDERNKAMIFDVIKLLGNSWQGMQEPERYLSNDRWGQVVDNFGEVCKRDRD